MIWDGPVLHRYRRFENISGNWRSTAPLPPLIAGQVAGFGRWPAITLIVQLLPVQGLLHPGNIRLGSSISNFLNV